MNRQQIGAGFVRRAFHPEEQAALVKLLAKPDPPDLRRRCHHLTQQGDRQKQKALLRWVVRVFLAKHTLARDVEAISPARTRKRRRPRPAPVLSIARSA
jgi:hypothetical protein